MEVLTIEAIAIISGFGIILIEKTYKKLKYIKKKRNLKNKLFKSIKENNKTNIKKYIIKSKDFDKKYNKNKLLKNLEFCCRKINGLNEDNIYALVEDFYFINMIYENEKEELELEITDNLDMKLKELEKKRKAIIIRANRIKGQSILKSNKMEKNKKQKRRGRM
tara:strand:- start:1652 stop:2143 length:492 start_codon:yes stop_codon:yes gene_type:complete